MTFGACCFGEVSALARTGLFTTSFRDASAVSAALDFARCWPRCFSHVSTSQQCVGCFFRILVFRPVSTISGLALVVRYWKATLGDLRRRLGTRSSQSLIFAVAMKGTPRRYARRARPDRRLDVEKNSNPPEAGDRPLGGGPGCHIARVGADSRVVRKTPGGRTVVVAGEGSPRWTAVVLLPLAPRCGRANKPQAANQSA